MLFEVRAGPILSNIILDTLTKQVRLSRYGRFVMDYFITLNLVKPVIDEIQTLHQSSLSWSHKTVYQKHEGVSSISPRSGNPPRHSTSTVDNDDMNMSVDSL